MNAGVEPAGDAMTSNPLQNPGLRAAGAPLLRVACAALLFVVVACFSRAGETTKKPFDIPAGEARTTLKQFSSQAGGRVLYSGDVVDGVTTNAVKGTFSPREALALMIDGTRLKVSEDPQNGGLAVVRASDPNAPRVAQTSTGDRPRNQNNGTSESTAEETITLSPFQVNASDDSGYRATNTLEGSRLNTPLRDTPGAISIFTRDFLNDIGATDLESILRYDLSAEIVEDTSDHRGTGQGEGSGAIENGATWRTRGLGGTASVNGFRSFANNSDVYNVERVGSNRGPNAILFGSGAAGGVLNLRTKSANVSQNTNTVEYRFGTFDAARATVDVNRALIRKKLALRVMGILSHEEKELPHLFTDKEGVTVAGQYRFAEATGLNLSYERTITAGVGGQAWGGVLDQVTRFFDALQSGTVVFNQARERYEVAATGAAVGAESGVGNSARRTLLVYGPDGPNSPPIMWEGASRTANRSTRTTNATRYPGETFTVLDEGVLPYNRVSAAGPATHTVSAVSNFTATFNHRLFEKLYLELAYNRSRENADVNRNNTSESLRADLDYRLPDGSLNPYFFGNGYYFMDPDQGFRHLRERDNDTLRAAISYDLDLGRRWGYHRFAAMVEQHRSRNMQFRAREQWADAPYGGTPEADANHVYRRRYFKIVGPYENYTIGYAARPHAVETHNSTFAGPLSTTWTPPNAGAVFDNESTTDSGLIVMQSYLFNRRLVTTLGLRDDRVETDFPNQIRDPATQIWRVARPGDSGYEMTELTDKGVRRSLGGVFHLNSHLSLTANASTGVDASNTTSRRVLPDDLGPAPFKAKGRDYGLNFSFLDNKLSGAARYYETRSDREDTNSRVQQVFTDPNRDVLNSFAHYFREAGVTTFEASAPIQSIDQLSQTPFMSTANGYLSDNVSKGYELEIIANPTQNWTLRFGFSHSERKRTNVLTEGEPWWAEQRELFDRLDTLYRQQTGQPSVMNRPFIAPNGTEGNLTVEDRIADSTVQLDNVRAIEERGYGNRPNKFNLWTRYSFTEGFLKRLSVAGGMRFQEKNIAGYHAESDQLLYGNDSFLTDLMLQYKTKGFLKWLPEKVSVTYQANVYNVFDNRDVIISSLVISSTGETYIRRGWRQTPRTAAFTVRMDF
jgi:outer membrane receptor protein involved in Fe transport